MAYEKLRKNINKACAGTLSMLINMIQHLNNPQDESTFIGIPFQILGFDILVDEDLKCWVLEINDHPSFNIFNCKDPTKGSDCNHKYC